MRVKKIMQDANLNKEEEILVNSSTDEETNLEDNKDSSNSNVEKEGLLKEIQRERDKRHELESKIADLESKFETNSPNSSQDDLDLELVADRLAPTLLKRGFITQQQKEDEDRAEQYARDLKDLSSKYDGSDGRPVFDPNDVANHAKKTGIFNLEAAYRDLHWKEIIDFEKKQSTSEDIETEKPNSANQNKSNERIPLTSEYLAKRIAEPDGKIWYEKNREKILAAMAKGQI